MLPTSSYGEHLPRPRPPWLGASRDGGSTPWARWFQSGGAAEQGRAWAQGGVRNKWYMILFRTHGLSCRAPCCGRFLHLWFAESYDDTGKQEVSIFVLSQPVFLRQYTNIHKLQGKACLSTTSALNMMPILSLQGSDSPQSVNRVYIHIYVPNIK